MAELGLFPLGMVLLPDEQVPLHIFEERYKELIGECVDLGRSFGLILSDESGMRAVGTEAEVIKVLDRLPDGRLNIVVRGGARFRVVRMTEGRSFLTAEVEGYPDEGEEVPDGDEVAECLLAFRRLAEAADAEPPDLPDPGSPLAFRVAGVVDFAPDVKQELLEMRSERERIQRLTDVMDEAVDAVLLRRTIRKRAAGNGHVTT